LSHWGGVVSDASERKGRLFGTTRWSVVLAAGDTRHPNSRAALVALCEAYWYPVYALARQLGHGVDVAQDYTQGFFVHLLEKGSLKAADPDRGRFRAFLRASFKNYLSSERERARAAKRGGGRLPITLDFETAESRLRYEPFHQQTPEVVFEKRWARTLLTRALECLRREMEASEDRDRLRCLEPYLTGFPRSRGYGDVAAELGLTKDAVKAAVRRLRRRFGQLLRAEVAQTVENPNDVEKEIRYLFEVIRS
jgi:RNA polymerase sigma-70 factor (ECF subfamily)